MALWGNNDAVPYLYNGAVGGTVSLNYSTKVITGTGKFFTIVGDDINGRRLIGEIYYKTGKAVRKASKDLLRTTGLAEGEVR